MSKLFIILFIQIFSENRKSPLKDKDEDGEQE
jgi:hypothetical protein